MTLENEVLNNDLKLVTKNFTNSLSDNVDLVIEKYTANKRDIEILKNQL